MKEPRSRAWAIVKELAGWGGESEGPSDDAPECAEKESAGSKMSRRPLALDPRLRIFVKNQYFHD